jgi:hypothetical protein
MRSIGKLANLVIGIFELVVIGMFKVVGYVVASLSAVAVIVQFWPMIDGARPYQSIFGVVGLIFAGWMVLAVIGEAFDPFDPFDIKNFSDTEDGARKATRDDLRKRGLI